MDNPYEPKLIEPSADKPIVIPFSEKHLIGHFVWFHGSFAVALFGAALLEYGPLRALWLLISQAPAFLLTCINGFVLWVPHGLLVTFHTKSRELNERVSAVVGVVAFFTPLLVHQLLVSAGAFTLKFASLLLVAPGSAIFSLVVVAAVAVIRHRVIHSRT